MCNSQTFNRQQAQTFHLTVPANIHERIEEIATALNMNPAEFVTTSIEEALDHWELELSACRCQ